MLNVSVSPNRASSGLVRDLGFLLPAQLRWRVSTRGRTRRRFHNSDITCDGIGPTKMTVGWIYT